MDFAAGRDNPSAIYDEGIRAKERLEDSRTRIARVLHVQARDIIFTSGGTESDNLAVLGVFEAAREKFPHPHIIVSNVEHPAILEAVREAEHRGAEVTYLLAEAGGAVDPEKLKAHFKPNTILVSVMYVNNETGALNPISRIARLIHAERKERGSVYPLMHTDASQAATVLPLDITALGVDMLTLDASKVGGPKGTGLLAARTHVPIQPIMFGGGQERGLRPGTESVEAILTFARALEEAQDKREESSKKLAKIQQLFISEVTRHVPKAIVNTPVERAPHIVSVSIPGALHEFLAIKLIGKGIYVSTGSSCSTNKRIDEKEALRFSFGIETTEEEITEAVRKLAEVVV